MSSIIDIAGKHLGRASDGTTVKPYVTPDKHDKTLLVPIPRNFGRQKLSISSSFVGYDVWHAYEMSFLRQNGMPATGLLRLCYDASSDSMVESKSLKLYLNSFDLERFDSVEQVEQIISTDVSEAVGGHVFVKLHLAEDSFIANKIFNVSFTNVDKLDLDISLYHETPDLLELDLNSSGVMTFHTANLRSNCEITNQKDTGNCFIYMKGAKLPTIESLTRYVISMRESQHFHENVTEILFDALMSRFECEDLVIANLYNRRGGISIFPVRGSSFTALDEVMNRFDDVDMMFERLVQE